MTLQELQFFHDVNGFTLKHTPGELYSQQIAEPRYIFRRSYLPVTPQQEEYIFREHCDNIAEYLKYEKLEDYLKNQHMQ